MTQTMRPIGNHLICLCWMTCITNVAKKCIFCKKKKKKERVLLMVYPLRITLHRTSSLGTCSLRRDSDRSTSSLTILGAKKVSKPLTKMSVSVSL